MASGSIIYRFIKPVNEFKPTKNRRPYQGKKEKPKLIEFYVIFIRTPTVFLLQNQKKKTIQSNDNKLIFITTIYYKVVQ